MAINPNIEPVESNEDIEDIIADQDQTSLHLDPSEDLRGKGGPSNLDLEDEPAEFTRGEIDVKTQMDRTTRIARANAMRHYDLDETPETTPGGLEEVIAKTDRDLKKSPSELAAALKDDGDEAMDDEGDSVSLEGKKFIDIDDVSEEVDLSSEQLDFGEMNEEDARESGYLDAESKESNPPRPAHTAKESPTGSFTDIGAGRSSAVKPKTDGKTGPLH